MKLEDQLSLKPTASEVACLNLWLDQCFVDCCLEKGLGADLKLCLNEVLDNLISYGFEGTEKPLAIVRISLEPSRASAIVWDNGGYFDLRARSTPVRQDLMTGDLGGFGIALIKERASQIHYSRSGDLNRLEIVCEISRP